MSGGRPTEVTPDDVLGVFENNEYQGERLTEPVIADILACSESTARNKLGDLVDDGRLETKKAGF